MQGRTRTNQRDYREELPETIPWCRADHGGAISLFLRPKSEGGVEIVKRVSGWVQKEIRSKCNKIPRWRFFLETLKKKQWNGGRNELQKKQKAKRRDTMKALFDRSLSSSLTFFFSWNLGLLCLGICRHRNRVREKDQLVLSSSAFRSCPPPIPCYKFFSRCLRLFFSLFIFIFSN